MGKIKGDFVPSEINFPLEEDEKAALYFIDLEKEDKGTVFLAFVARDDFFHSKPYNQQSNKYLLLRYLGDLCQDIVLLYDDKMEKDFEL